MKKWLFAGFMILSVLKAQAELQTDAPKLYELLGRQIPEAISNGLIPAELENALGVEILNYKASQAAKPRSTDASTTPEALRDPTTPRPKALEPWLESQQSGRRERLKSLESEDPEIHSYLTESKITSRDADNFAVSIARGGPEWIFLLRKTQANGLFGLGPAYTTARSPLALSDKTKDLILAQTEAMTRDFSALLETRRRDFDREYSQMIRDFYRSIVFTTLAPIDFKTQQPQKFEAMKNLNSLKTLLALKNERRPSLGQIQPEITDSAIDCNGIAKVAVNSARVVLDPGHLGGTYAEDHRSSCTAAPDHPACGYREGVATFVMSGLVKDLLVRCAGLNSKNVLLTRQGLEDVGGWSFKKDGTRLTESPRASALAYDNLPFRTSLIRWAKPDVAVSIHTDAIEEQMGTIFTPRGVFANGISFYKTPESLERSEKLSKAMDASMQATFFDPQSVDCLVAARYDFNGFSKQESDFHVLRSADTFPMILVETISHRPNWFKAASNEAFSLRTPGPRFKIGGREYGYIKVHECLARGVAQGIVSYLNQRETRR